MENKWKNLKPGSHIHLMGIGGTAMGSLAGIFSKMGYRVTGSDQNVYPPMSVQLAQLGINVINGYRPENLSDKPDLVIVGNVIGKMNPEAQRLMELDIPYSSLPQALGEFIIGKKESIVIAGTHGKTTTTSMVAWMADQCGVDSGFLIGGIPENYGVSFKVSKGNWFVIEGDEYDTAYFDKVPKFIHYRPKYVILTSIEFDHADIYPDLNAIKNAFKKLIELIPADGHLVVWDGCKNIKELLPLAKCPVTTYGIESGDYMATERTLIHGRNQFCVVKNKQKIADIAIKLFGEHNTLNSLATFTLGQVLGWNSTKILQSLASFTGVRRRQQILGEPGGILIVEDFAHHPTAVRLTINSIKEKYPHRKVFAVFEPRSATSRRKVFQKDYVEALKRGDEVIVANAFDQTKIEDDNRFSSEQLVEELRLQKVKTHLGVNTQEIIDCLFKYAKKGDVILIMSNGGFDGIYQKLLTRLEKKLEI
ncbi:MAG: UDP-N-acetylmuramate:L-alanyl-gamma-D-glutamyl-meso-diaminopimelate ligase [Bdellovibrionales bacterium]|nr:UDP-N-acetylmuramate:L-alanyl-gamma-D-glutamyl-meso-diaminopimelate ligase [Bdellovibrionales bacterium]